MEKSEQSQSLWIYLIWIGVFLSACLIAFFAWRTLGKLEVQVFALGTDNLIELLEQIEKIQQHYAQESVELKQVLEI